MSCVTPRSPVHVPSDDGSAERRRAQRLNFLEEEKARIESELKSLGLGAERTRRAKDRLASVVREIEALKASAQVAA